MRYAIVANPASGGKALHRKRLLLGEAAKILDANIHGLDTRNPEEFKECVIRAARLCDVLVAAGGDGTLSIVVNAIDRAITPVSFLPLGTGNAMRDALRLQGSLSDIALRIRDAPIRRIDLVDCGGRVAFFASVGIEADVLRVRRRHPKLRKSGFASYFLAALVAYFRTYRRVSGILRVDSAESPLDRLLTLMVVKHPFLGFGMRVVPWAGLDDGKLHILAVNSSFWKLLLGGAAALVFQNRSGRYYTGRSVQAVFERPCFLQMDGEECWAAQTFRFKLLKSAIMIKV